MDIDDLVATSAFHTNTGAPDPATRYPLFFLPDDTEIERASLDLLHFGHGRTPCSVVVRPFQLPALCYSDIDLQGMRAPDPGIIALRY
jgi:hypothetical protein